MLQGKAGDIFGNSSNLDTQMYIAQLETDIGILLFARMLKGRVNQIEKRKSMLSKVVEIQTKKRKLTFREREQSPIMFIRHWLLLINKNKASFF